MTDAPRDWNDASRSRNAQLSAVQPIAPGISAQPGAGISGVPVACGYTYRTSVPVTRARSKWEPDVEGSSIAGSRLPSIPAAAPSSTGAGNREKSDISLRAGLSAGPG